MIDAEVAAWLAKNIRPGPDFRLLVVGDEHQLPSVGHGRVLADLLAADVISVSRLTIVQRQATGSRIVQQAHRILERQPLLVGDTHDWTVVPLPGEAEAAQAVVIRAVRRVLREEATSILPRDRAFDARRDLQVLTPRVGGALGVEALNEKLRELVNPGAGDGPWVAGGQRVREGDRVTCIHNDYTVEPDGLMNGEQGVVRAVEGDALRLLLDDGREVRTRGVQNKSVALAFAATVHRAQGSEYPVVLLVYHRSHAPLLDQRVLYTGVTRAKQRVILCADPEALRVSAATGAALERCSGLAARIRRRQRARSAE
jgi:exodeoxyribonuclease V alpha subunit